MADFCRQCSIAIFGEDYGDFLGLTNPEEKAMNETTGEEEFQYAVVLCEGCGAIQVDAEGNCISEDCAEQHGRKPIP